MFLKIIKLKRDNKNDFKLYNFFDSKFNFLIYTPKEIFKFFKLKVFNVFLQKKLKYFQVEYFFFYLLRYNLKLNFLFLKKNIYFLKFYFINVIKKNIFFLINELFLSQLRFYIHNRFLLKNSSNSLDLKRSKILLKKKIYNKTKIFTLITKIIQYFSNTVKLNAKSLKKTTTENLNISFVQSLKSEFVSKLKKKKLNLFKISILKANLIKKKKYFRLNYKRNIRIIRYKKIYNLKLLKKLQLKKIILQLKEETYKKNKKIFIQSNDSINFLISNIKTKNLVKKNYINIQKQKKIKRKN